MARTAPTKPVLDRLLRHAAYEYVALTELYDRFTKGGRKSVPLFESLLIHARNGYVFLYKRPGQKGAHARDVFAADYLSNWSASASTLMSEAYVRVHVQVAHLSSDRGTPANEYSWNDWLKHLPTLVRELNADWKRFGKQLLGKRSTLFLAGAKGEKRRLRGK